MTHPSLNFAGLLCNFESLLFCFLLKAMYPVVKPGMHLFHWIMSSKKGDHGCSGSWWCAFNYQVTLVAFVWFPIMFELSPLAQSHWLEKGVCGIWSGQPSALWAGRCFQLTTWAPDHLPRSLVTSVSHWPRLGESEEQVKECRSNTSLYSAHNSFVSWAQNQKQERNHAGEWSVTRMGQGGWAECQDMRVARPAGCLQLPPSVSVTVRDPRWNLDPGPARNPSHVTFGD